jgi:hypothetical protein
MENGFSLKKQGVIARMGQHPVGTFLGAAVTATICGVLGMIHGETAAAVMVVLGLVVGGPLGAMTAASAQNQA